MWEHPADHYSIELDSDWKVEPVTVSQLDQGSSSKTVIQARLLKDNYTALVQHYPCSGLISEFIKQGLAAPLKALGVNIKWKEETISNRKVSVSFYKTNNTRLTCFARWGDMGFGIDVWSNGSAVKEKLMKLLETIIAALKCEKKLNTDPTNGKKYLLGQWTSGSSDYSKGLYNDNSFSGRTTLTFNPDGSMSFYEMSSFTFYGSDYGGSTNEQGGGGYYRVLDDIIYLYGTDAVVIIPFSVGMGSLRFGKKQFIKNN